MTDGVVVTDLVVRSSAGVLVAGTSFTLERGRCLAIIGESGSGKSMTAKAITGLLPGGVTATGSVSYGAETIALPASVQTWHGVRGARAVLLLQDPFTSLSPVHRCGDQVAWSIAAREERHGRPAPRGADAAAEVRTRLAEVGLPDRVARMHPHELSGGMRQRVAIAAALASEPDLLIADEPTTALDASLQGEVLDLLRTLQQRHRMAMLLISHDLGLVRGRADDVLVMKDGEVVERGPAAVVLSTPAHDYSRALLAASPSLDRLAPADVTGSPTGNAEADAPVPLLEVTGLTKVFGAHTALDDVSVRVARREIVAIVGESGSGKSTLARCVAGLERPDAGQMVFAGEPLPPGRHERTPSQVQIVFQDPYSTLNPMMSVGQTLAEALRASGRTKADVGELLDLVGLDRAFASRRPARLSGGQRQRVAIARALAPAPDLLICDESVSALDVSVQAQILDLLASLRDTLDLSILFISHDLAVVGQISDRLYVLNRGRVVEQGVTAHVLTTPDDPYTRTLVAAARRDTV